MDWILALTTLLVNSNLGWSKGSRSAWGLHMLNSVSWAVYALHTNQPGIVMLSAASIAIDFYSLSKTL